MIPSPIQFDGRPAKGDPYDVKTGDAAHSAGFTHIIFMRSFARSTVHSPLADNLGLTML